MRLKGPVLLLLYMLGCNIIYSQTATVSDTIEINGGIFQKVEVEAYYPGGEQAWRRFLEKNLNPNVPVDNNAPVGQYTVIAQFYVAKDGKVSDVKALTNHGYGMEQEVVQVLKKSGNWMPAMQNGKPVNAYRKQPMTFVVMSDGFEISTETPYVLYTGRDNEISVKVDKTKNEDIQLIISQGTVTAKGDGKFIVNVKRPGKAIITVFGKKNKEVGKMNFEVREPR